MNIDISILTIEKKVNLLKNLLLDLDSNYNLTINAEGINHCINRNNKDFIEIYYKKEDFPYINTKVYINVEYNDYNDEPFD